MKIWSCKIGECDEGDVPEGSDLLIRRAVEMAYGEITGKPPEYIFSGWGAKLNETQREIIGHERVSATETDK